MLYNNFFQISRSIEPISYIFRIYRLYGHLLFQYTNGRKLRFFLPFSLIDCTINTCMDRCFYDWPNISNDIPPQNWLLFLKYCYPLPWVVDFFPVSCFSQTSNLLLLGSDPLLAPLATPLCLWYPLYCLGVNSTIFKSLQTIPYFWSWHKFSRPFFTNFEIIYLAVPPLIYVCGDIRLFS